MVERIANVAIRFLVRLQITASSIQNGWEKEVKSYEIDFVFRVIA